METVCARRKHTRVSGSTFPHEVVKTRLLKLNSDVYTAYRKAGYSKQFLAEHESEILLHKAAKKAFDDMGLEKLPTIKSLQAEYAALLAEKKNLYPEFSEIRREMRDLQMARANVARLMGYEEKSQEREKEKEAGETPKNSI